MSRVPVAPGTLDFRPWAQRFGLPWSGETPKALLGGNPGCRGSLNVSKDVIWSASEPWYARYKFSRVYSCARRRLYLSIILICVIRCGQTRIIAMEGGGLSNSLTYSSRQSDGSGGYGDLQMSGLTWRKCTDAGDMCDAEK